MRWAILVSLGNQLSWWPKKYESTVNWPWYALIVLTVLVVCAKSELGVEIVKAIGGR